MNFLDVIQVMAAALLFIIILFVWLLIWKSPEGYEDSSGFHTGTEPGHNEEDFVGRERELETKCPEGEFHRWKPAGGGYSRCLNCGAVKDW